MRYKALALALLVVVSGCTGSPADTNREDRSEDEQTDEPPSETVERTLIYTGPIDAGTESRAVSVGGQEVLGVGLVEIETDLVWTQPTNTFHVRSIRPDGTEHRTTVDDPASTRAEGNVTRLEPGDWTFRVHVEGTHVSDTVKLFVNVTWRVPADGGTPLGGSGVLGDVETAQRGDQWVAWQRHTANGTAAGDMEVDVNTTNGAVLLDATGSAETSTSATQAALPTGVRQAQSTADDEVQIVVNTSARADTEEDARERLDDVNVTILLADESITVRAEAADWQKRGASATVRVPTNTTVSGVLDTTNGAIGLREVDASGLEAGTTNGAVRGSMTGSGPLALDTTNGAIDLAFTPTATASLEADTTNGAIDLELHEASDVGYQIDADTTNGEITADMEEASLEGSETEATLVTDGYDSRPIQVDGIADTTNANIAFASP
jgi:hypothetical protein